MPKPSSKRSKPASSDSDSDSGPEDRGPAKRAPAPEKKSKPDASSGDGEKSWAIDKMKFVKVREFKGKLYVDIREYYEKNGDMLPGKKGVSLNVASWNKLKDVISDVDEELSKH